MFIKGLIALASQQVKSTHYFARLQSNFSVHSHQYKERPTSRDSVVEFRKNVFNRRRVEIVRSGVAVDTGRVARIAIILFIIG